MIRAEVLHRRGWVLAGFRFCELCGRLAPDCEPSDFIEGAPACKACRDEIDSVITQHQHEQSLASQLDWYPEEST